MSRLKRGLARATRNTAIAASLLSLTFAPVVHANGQRHSGHSFTDYARVINVDPIYTRVAYDKPRQECWLEEQHHTTVYEGNAHQRRHNYQNHRNQRTHNAGGTIAGGVIGGVIGNQLGKNAKHGARIGATVVGAIIGSAIGNERPRGSHRRRHNSNHAPVQRVVKSRPVERCTTHVSTEYRKEISGYQVTYRYKGQTFTTRTDRDPGSRIPVTISIRPQNH